MSLEIRAADYDQDGDRFVVLRSHDGASPIPHVFPADTLEWRAAEYDLDPADLDTLLRIVLYEPLVDHQVDHPLHLFNAPTITAAREHHLSQIRAAMRAHPLVDADGHLHIVRQHAHMDSDAIAVKRAHVQRHRQHKAAASGAAAGRVDRLRQQLDRPAPPPQLPPEPELPDTNAVIRALADEED